MDDIDESNLPTKKDVIKVCDLIVQEIQKINRLRESDQEMRFKSYDEIIKLLDKLKSYEGVDNFSDIFFDSSLNDQFSFLVSTPNTQISSSFISLLTDICENSSMSDVVKRSDYLIEAISCCVPLSEISIQSDAQFLYNTFNLISVILDDCEDASGFAATLLKDTEILNLIKRQLKRDDFDENVLAATETLAILLQLQPSYIEEEEEFRPKTTKNENENEEEEEENGSAELLNLLLRFVANEKNPKSASEDEAAHNGFNALTLFALNKKGNELLVQLNGIEALIECWAPKSKTALLAIETLETALAASTPCCIQFVNAGGLKKLFKALDDEKTLKSKKISSSIVGILDALLTMLPIDQLEESTDKQTDKQDDKSDDKSLDPEGKCFQKVLKKFKKKKSKNVTNLIKLSESVFENVSDEDTESMDVFQMCACCIAIICGYSINKVRAQIFMDVNNSEILEFQLIKDSAELRIEDAKSIAPRVNYGLKTLDKVLESVKGDE